MNSAHPWKILVVTPHGSMEIMKNTTEALTFGNLVKVSLNKEKFESNMEKEVGRIKSSMETVGEGTGYSVETK